jgi:hypothetical protein
MGLQSRDSFGGSPVTRKLVMRGQASRCNKHLDRARRDQSAERGRTSAVLKISSQLPTEGYRRKEIDGRNEHTGGAGAGSAAATVLGRERRRRGGGKRRRGGARPESAPARWRRCAAGAGGGVCGPGGARREAAPGAAGGPAVAMAAPELNAS